MTETRPLYLIRHGQTEWNRKGRLQGGKDSPLTVLGRQQAKAAAISLQKTAPRSILASPLGLAEAKFAQALVLGDRDVEDVGDDLSRRLGAAEWTCLD